MLDGCTIVLPTTNRPCMLRNVLESIRRQTALDRVTRVIVSENAGGSQTASVCAEFPDLPIEYHFQQLPLGPKEHLSLLLGMNSDPYVALVCDDDWWAPGHLAVALRELDLTPECVAHVSAHVWADCEIPTRSGSQEQELLWVAAGRPVAQSAWRLEPDAVLALCTLLTPFTYSSLVMRGIFGERVVLALGEVEHSLLLDRACFPALARMGPILYEPSVDTYYRVHGGNYTTGKSPSWLLGLRIRGSNEFQRYATEHGVDVAVLVAEWYALLSPRAAKRLARRLLSELGYRRAVAMGVPRRQASRAAIGLARERVSANVRYWARLVTRAVGRIAE
jgi:glycosyltransferase involved in cell wall biosynthesis